MNLKVNSTVENIESNIQIIVNRLLQFNMAAPMSTIAQPHLKIIDS